MIKLDFNLIKKLINNYALGEREKQYIFKNISIVFVSLLFISCGVNSSKLKFISPHNIDLNENKKIVTTLKVNKEDDNIIYTISENSNVSQFKVMVNSSTGIVEFITDNAPLYDTNNKTFNFTVRATLNNINIYQKINVIIQDVLLTQHELIELVDRLNTDDPYQEDIKAIEEFDISFITDISKLFYNKTKFNQNISKWDVSKIEDMQSIFDGATAFNNNNQPLDWDVSDVTNMAGMFNGATMFNQDISKWNVSSVTNMESMFNDASAFNKDISEWNVISVTNMANMFNDAIAFDQNISSWNVTKVTNMEGMFGGATVFNQNISKWDVSGVTNMGTMFANAIAFDQNISGWNVTSVTNFTNFYENAAKLEINNSQVPEKFR